MKTKYLKYQNVMSESDFHDLAFNLVGNSGESAIEFSKNIPYL